MSKRKDEQMYMYTQPPPCWGPPQQQQPMYIAVPGQGSQDNVDRILKFAEKLAKKEAKKKDADKPKEEKKPELTFGQSLILTMVSAPIIGSAYVYLFATAIKLSIAQLQSVLH